MDMMQNIVYFNIFYYNNKNTTTKELQYFDEIFQTEKDNKTIFNKTMRWFCLNIGNILLEYLEYFDKILPIFYSNNLYFVKIFE